VGAVKYSGWLDVMEEGREPGDWQLSYCLNEGYLRRFITYAFTW
jgi:hypothetical protein